MLFSACNNDIFVNNEELPDNLWIPINSDGEQWSSTFSRKGLERIYITGDQNFKEYIRYYYKNGIETGDDVRAEDLEAIYLDTPVLSYSFGFQGDMISFTNYYNSFSSSVEIELNLQYSHGFTKHLYFEISQGSPIESFSLYDNDLSIEENIETITQSGSFTNNSSLTQYMQLFPYVSSHCTYLVQTNDKWANNLEVKMPLPLYISGTWGLHEFEEIRIGDLTGFLSPQEKTEYVEIEIPPYKKAIVTFSINYSKAKQSGLFYFVNKVTEVMTEEEFICTAICPTSYDLNVTYE